MPTTTNMGLVLPTVSQTVGPEYATQLNQALTDIDAHNHSAGDGSRIPSNALNITSDLTLQSNNLISARTVRYAGFAAGTTPSSSTDIGNTFVSGPDLFYTDTAGNQIRLTSGGSIVAASSGQIVGLTAPASVTYSATSSTFIFSSSANTYGNVSFAQRVVTKTANYTIDPNDSVVLANAATSGFQLTLPSAPLNSGKLITLKAITTPASNSVSIVSTAGNIDGLTRQSISGTGESVSYVSDGSNWASVSRNSTVALITGKNNSQSFTPSSAVTILWDAPSVDTHQGLNVSTGVYTVPVTGLYSFTASVYAQAAAWIAGENVRVTALRNISTVLREQFKEVEANNTMIFGIPVSGLVSLSAGDSFTIAFSNTFGSGTPSGENGFCYLNMYLVSQAQ